MAIKDNYFELIVTLRVFKINRISEKKIQIHDISILNIKVYILLFYLFIHF